jgi:hypothetical protein
MWRIGVNARFKSLGGQSPADTFAARARASGRCAVYDGAQSFPVDTGGGGFVRAMQQRSISPFAM